MPMLILSYDLKGDQPKDDGRQIRLEQELEQNFQAKRIQESVWILHTTIHAHRIADHLKEKELVRLADGATDNDELTIVPVDLNSYSAFLSRNGKQAMNEIIRSIAVARGAGQ